MILLTVEEVADQLRLPQKTVRYLMDKEGLPYVRMGERIRVIDKHDLDKWLEGRKVKTEEAKQ